GPVRPEATTKELDGGPRGPPATVDIGLTGKKVRSNIDGGARAVKAPRAGGRRSPVGSRRGNASGQPPRYAGSLMHAANWPGAFSASGGVMAAQSASFSGCGQRGWKGHPEGGATGLGTSPLSTMRPLRPPGRGTGTAERSARV